MCLVNITGVALAAGISQIELRSNILTAFWCNFKIIKNFKLFVFFFLRHLDDIGLKIIQLITHGMKHS